MPVSPLIMSKLEQAEPGATQGDLNRLRGRVVLVKSTRDRRNPPTAMRGTIEVRDNPGATPDVSIAVEFPQMFSTPAHHRTFPLDHAGISRLLDSEYNGTFEFTI